MQHLHMEAYTCYERTRIPVSKCHNKATHCGHFHDVYADEDSCAQNVLCVCVCVCVYVCVCMCVCVSFGILFFYVYRLQHNNNCSGGTDLGGYKVCCIAVTAVSFKIILACTVLHHCSMKNIMITDKDPNSCHPKVSSVHFISILYYTHSCSLFSLPHVCTIFIVVLARLLGR